MHAGQGGGRRLREDVHRASGPGGATVADVALMRRVVGAEMGVKAAGGVRDLDGLKAMVAAGATRVGASAGVRIVQQSQGRQARDNRRGYCGADTVRTLDDEKRRH